MRDSVNSTLPLFDNAAGALNVHPLIIVDPSRQSDDPNICAPNPPFDLKYVRTSISRVRINLHLSAGHRLVLQLCRCTKIRRGVLKRNGVMASIRSQLPVLAVQNARNRRAFLAVFCGHSYTHSHQHILASFHCR